LAKIYSDRKIEVIIAERQRRDLAAQRDGYTQAEIAKYLKMSRSNVSKIVKSVFSTPDPKVLLLYKLYVMVRIIQIQR